MNWLILRLIYNFSVLFYLTVKNYFVYITICPVGWVFSLIALLDMGIHSYPRGPTGHFNLGKMNHFLSTYAIINLYDLAYHVHFIVEPGIF